MIETGKTVKVVKNTSGSTAFDFLIGKIGTVACVLGKDLIEIQFDYDEEWASQDYFASPDEVEEYLC
jgi:hypothetical protein